MNDTPYIQKKRQKKFHIMYVRDITLFIKGIIILIFIYHKL